MSELQSFESPQLMCSCSPLRALGFLLHLTCFIVIIIIIKKKNHNNKTTKKKPNKNNNNWRIPLAFWIGECQIVKWCFEGQLGKWKAWDDPGMLFHIWDNASMFSLSSFFQHITTGFFPTFAKLCTLLKPGWLMVVLGEQSFYLPWTLESSFRKMVFCVKYNSKLTWEGI